MPGVRPHAGYVGTLVWPREILVPPRHLLPAFVQPEKGPKSPGTMPKGDWSLFSAYYMSLPLGRSAPTHLSVYPPEHVSILISENIPDPSAMDDPYRG